MIRHKTKKMVEIEMKYSQPIKDLLYHLYIEQQMSCSEISQKFNIAKNTVMQWLQYFNINPIRSLSECGKIFYKSHHPHNYRIQEIESKHQEKLPILLKQLYLDAKFSSSQIAKIFGMSPSTVYSWLKRFHIPIRSASEVTTLVWANQEYKNKAKLSLKRNSYSCQKIAESVKKLWKNPKYRQKQLTAHKTSTVRHKFPNKPEILINQLTPNYIKYTGNGTFWKQLSNDKISNPDFIVEPIKKTKKVIFFHGIYWHRDELHNRGQDLINQWKQLGYKCLIIWEDELFNLKPVLQKIAEFIEQDTWQMNLF